MNNERKSEFYLVREEILPEAIKKTILVKEILKRGKMKTVNEAVSKVGLSRSAYYKYKDYVFPFYDASKEKSSPSPCCWNISPGFFPVCSIPLLQTEAA